MTLLTVNKKLICNVAFINVMSKVVVSKVLKYCYSVIEIYYFIVSDHLVTIYYIYHKFVGKYSENFFNSKTFSKLPKIRKREECNLLEAVTYQFQGPVS